MNEKHGWVTENTDIWVRRPCLEKKLAEVLSLLTTDNWHCKAATLGPDKGYGWPRLKDVVSKRCKLQIKALLWWKLNCSPIFAGAAYSIFAGSANFIFMATDRFPVKNRPTMLGDLGALVILRTSGTPGPGNSFWPKHPQDILAYLPLQQQCQQADIPLSSLKAWTYNSENNLAKIIWSIPSRARMLWTKWKFLLICGCSAYICGG